MAVCEVNISTIIFSFAQSRGCSLLGMEACPDTESQVKRYHDNGWEGAWSMDMAEVYARLPRDDVARCVCVVCCVQLIAYLCQIIAA